MGVARNVRRGITLASNSYKAYKYVQGAAKKPATRSKSSAGSRAAVRSESSASVGRGRATKGRQVIKRKALSGLKPTKKFKALVAKCEEKAMITGVISQKYFQTLTALNANAQSLYNNIGTDGTNSAPSVLFGPLQILDAASLLFNSKVPAINSLNSTTNSFDIHNSVVHVLSAYSTFHFKNDSQRTYTLRFYECSPKAMYDTNAVAGIVDSITFWQKCLADDVTLGTARQVYNGAGVVNPDVTNLGNQPGMTSAWSRVIKSTLQTIVLEPGQTFTKIVNGPKGAKYDYSKFFKDGFYCEWQKGLSVGFIVSLTLDLTQSSTAASVARMAAPATAGVLCERTDHFVIGMPEQAGFVYPASTAAGTTQLLNNRKRTFMHNMYAFGPGTGTVVDVNDENPAVMSV